MKRKNVTIKDISVFSGVSTATVSRVLHSPEQVKANTRCKIIDAIKHLDYRLYNSDNNASLFDATCKTIYIYVPNLFNESFLQIIQGLTDTFYKQNLNSVIWYTSENKDIESRYHQFINNGLALGVVAINSAVEDVQLSKFALLTPVLTVDRHFQENNVDSITVDTEQGIKVLIEHLVSLGHKQIGFLCGDIGSADSLNKIAHFKRYILENRIDWNSSSIISTDWTLAGGYRGISRMLEAVPLTTAAICSTDTLALGAIYGLQKIGLRCPEDFSITGFNNLPNKDYINPKITTLNYPNYEIGEFAAKVLIDRINNFPDIKFKKINKIYPLRLLIGDSTCINKYK